MCDVNGQFKLCTCSDKIDKTKPYWVLNKGTLKNKNTDLEYVMFLIKQKYNNLSN